MIIWEIYKISIKSEQFRLMLRSDDIVIKGDYYG